MQKRSPLWAHISPWSIFQFNGLLCLWIFSLPIAQANCLRALTGILFPPPALDHALFQKDQWVYLPVIGDVHGGLTILEELLIRLQNQLQVKFPWVLQVGDLGIYQGQLAYRSNWHQRNIPDFNDLLNANHRIRRALWRSKQVRANLLFVRGNHDELHSDFSMATTLVPISVLKNPDRPPFASSKLFYLPDGVNAKLEIFPGHEIRAIGFGGINVPGMSDKIQTEEGPGIGYNLQALDALRARHQEQEVDIFLTHQAPSFQTKGSPTIDELVTHLRPRFHFHGHSHEIITPRQRAMGATTSVALGNLPHCEADNPEKMCWQIIRYHLDDQQWELVPL